MEKEKEFMAACNNGSIKRVQELLDQGVDPSAYNNSGIRWACENGHIKVVKLLLSLDESKGIDPSADNNDGFQWACYGDHIEVIKVLLSLDESRGVDPSTDEYYRFMKLDFSDNDKELFLSFIHHPKFYSSDASNDTSGILPVRVQRKVEELEKKFFGTEKGIRAKPSRRLKKIN